MGKVCCELPRSNTERCFSSLDTNTASTKVFLLFSSRSQKLLRGVNAEDPSNYDWTASILLTTKGVTEACTRTPQETANQWLLTKSGKQKHRTIINSFQGRFWLGWLPFWDIHETCRVLSTWWTEIIDFLHLNAFPLDEHWQNDGNISMVFD